MPSRPVRGSLVWLRRDLRLQDNVAIACAIQKFTGPVHLVFVFDTNILNALPHRQDRRVNFIHDAVSTIDAQLRQSGACLHIRHGVAQQHIPALAEELNCQQVVAATDYEPAAVVRDRLVKEQLNASGIELRLVKDHVVFERSELMTGSNTAYTVFTPYKKKWLASLVPTQLNSLQYELSNRLHKRPGGQPHKPIPSLQTLGFEKTDLASLGIQANESAALKMLEEFEARMALYQEQRNFPAIRGVSYLSVHLRFGTLSIREAARRAWEVVQAQPDKSDGARTWLSELIWRDFYFQILHHYPHVVDQSFKPAYDTIEWSNDQALFDSWCQGKTGYPLVDAAMAQINQTGYMHNRLRMVVASFLTKDLGINWQWGEKYFADHLNDFDLAANNGGWQWAASSGCDAQPYFRIFNPVTQSRRFDPQGKFIRRYLPTIAALSDKHIHAPWTAGPIELAAAGIELGNDYPLPVVDHDNARRSTLARYDIVKRQPG
ncbi:MAG: deoxyribodipyrimidine photo-lyase [Burkholderiaceae bacterium]